MDAYGLLSAPWPGQEDTGAVPIVRSRSFLEDRQHNNLRITLAMFHSLVSDLDRTRLSECFTRISTSQNFVPWSLLLAGGTFWQPSFYQQAGRRDHPEPVERLPAAPPVIRPELRISRTVQLMDIDVLENEDFARGITIRREHAQRARVHEDKMRRIQRAAPVTAAEADSECCICMEAIVRCHSSLGTDKEIETFIYNYYEYPNELRYAHTP